MHQQKQWSKQVNMDSGRMFLRKEMYSVHLLDLKDTPSEKNNVCFQEDSKAHFYAGRPVFVSFTLILMMMVWKYLSSQTLQTFLNKGSCFFYSNILLTMTAVPIGCLLLWLDGPWFSRVTVSFWGISQHCCNDEPFSALWPKEFSPQTHSSRMIPDGGSLW